MKLCVGLILECAQILIVGGAFLLFGPKKVSAFFMKESRLQAAIITSIGEAHCPT